MRYHNLVLIGTSHIAAESIAKVMRVIHEVRPAIVALELDRKRLWALFNPEKAKTSLKDIRRVGFKGYLFSLIGAYVERKLGEKVGVSPGTEMRAAVEAAREVGATLALIDQDIEITLRRFSQSLSAKEKWYALVDVFKGVVLRKSEFTFDLSKVPSKKVIARMIAKVQKRYPNIYRVLVTERNQVMAHRLAHLIRAHPDKQVVAVVGAGHEQELLKLIRQELS